MYLQWQKHSGSWTAALFAGGVSAVACKLLSITGGEEVEPKKRTRADN